MHVIIYSIFLGVLFFGASVESQEISENEAQRVQRLLDETGRQLGELKRQLEVVKKERNNLKDAISRFPGNSVPKGAIISFDTEECPDGWKNIGKEDSSRFAGRAIIATGPHVVRDEGQTTVLRKLGDAGGQEKVKLEEEHLPSHYHPLSWDKGGDHISEFLGGSKKDYGIAREFNEDRVILDNEKKRGKTVGPSGRDRLHENMPPFIALNLCKKE